MSTGGVAGARPESPVTWEHALHWYFKRTVSNGELLGGRRFHGARLGDLALAVGGAA